MGDIALDVGDLCEYDAGDDTPTRGRQEESMPFSTPPETLKEAINEAYTVSIPIHPALWGPTPESRWVRITKLRARELHRRHPDLLWSWEERLSYSPWRYLLLEATEGPRP